MNLFKNSTYNLIAAVLPLIVGLITIPLYVRTIGIATYGVIAIILAALGYLGFLDLGLGKALTQKIAELGGGKQIRKQHLVSVATAMTLLICILFSIIVWSLLMNLGYFSFFSVMETKTIQIYVPYIVAFIPIILFSSIFQGILQAESKYLVLSMIQLIGSVAMQVIPLLIALLGNIEVEALISGILIARCITLALLVKEAHAVVKIKFNLNTLKRRRHDLISYGGYSSMISILNQFLVMFDRFVILNLCGARAVTFYTIPSDLFSKILILPNSVSSPLFTIAANKNIKNIEKITDDITLVIIRLITPITLVLIYFGNYFVEKWVGAEIADNTGYVTLFLVAGLYFNALVIPKHSEILATIGPKVMVKCYLLELPLYIIGLWVLVKNYGISGAAFAWMLRCSLDSILILTISNSLKNTFKSCYKYFGLILLSIIFNLSFIISYNYLILLFIFELLILIIIDMKFYKIFLNEYIRRYK
jgi:O-antigen/teichoic acid export membrane protein